MLRISENNASIETVTLLLEGQISNHGVEITRESCEQVLKKGGHLILDMSGVSFVDRTGIALLRKLQQQNVELINCSPFLKEQLKDPISV